MEKPNQIENPDLTTLREICQHYINFIDNDEKYHEDNDYRHYIFEAAIETIFGKDAVWEFINKRRP